MTAAASVASRGVSVLTGLVTVPVTLQYLGVERYGLWITISSLLLILNAADLGLGNGLLSSIAMAHGRNDRSEIRRLVSSGFFMLACSALAVGLAGFAVLPWLDLGALFRLGSNAAILEARQSIMVVLVVFMLSLPATIGMRLQEALQEGYRSHCTYMFGNLMSLGFLVAGVHCRVGLGWLALLLLAGPCLSIWGLWVLEFGRDKPWARPCWQSVSVGTIHRLFKTGGVFLAMNLLTALGYQTDSIIIARMLGAEEVTTFAVAQRLSMVAMLYWAFIQAHWPAYSEAMARGDHAWIRKTIRRSLKVSIWCGGVIGGLYWLLGEWIIGIWVGPSVVPGKGLLAGFAVSILVTGIVATHAVVLNAGLLLRRTLHLLLITAPVSVLLKVLLCQHWGSQGAIWGTNLAFGLLFIPVANRLIRDAFCREPRKPA